MLYELESGDPAYQTISKELFPAPVKFTLLIKTEREAGLLVDALIQWEPYLRTEWLTKGIPDRLSVARRLLQEAAGLVKASNSEV